MTVRVVSAPANAVTQGGTSAAIPRLDGPEGASAVALAAIDQGLLKQWTPSAVSHQREWHELFRADGRDAREIFATGGGVTSQSNAYGDPMYFTPAAGTCTTAGTNVLTGIVLTDGQLVVGQVIRSIGNIPINTTITAILSSTSVQLSNAATTTASGVTFSVLPQTAQLDDGYAMKRSTYRYASGTVSYPIDGWLPLDEWTCAMNVWPGTQDLTAYSGTISLIVALGGIQSLRITYLSNAITARIELDERGQDPAGALYFFQTSLTIAAGDVKPFVGTPLWVAFDRTAGTLKVTLGDNVKTATNTVTTASFNATTTVGSKALGSPTTGTGTKVVGQTVTGTGIPAGTYLTNLTPLTMSKAATANGTVAIAGTLAGGYWLRHPWRGDQRLGSGGLFVGTDRGTGGTETGISIEGPRFYRYEMVAATAEPKPFCGATVDANTTSGAFPIDLVGATEQYTTWDGTGTTVEDAKPNGAAMRAQQIAWYGGAGAKVIRFTETSHLMNIVVNTTSPPGTVTSVDTTEWWIRWKRFLDAGVERGHWHIGYTPQAVGGGTASSSAQSRTLPTIAGFTQAQANDLTARVWSAAITDLKARMTAAGYTLSTVLKSVSWWNEPHGFGAIPAAGHRDYWEAVATRLATDHPDIPKVGMPDMVISNQSNLPAYPAATTNDDEETVYETLLDRAAVIGHVPSCIQNHGYATSSVFNALSGLDHAVSKAERAGFTRSQYKLGVTEWGIIGALGSNPLHAISMENPPRQHSAWMGAYMHDYLSYMADYGVETGIFYRLGGQDTFYPAEMMMSLLSRQYPSRPLLSGTTFALMWKHKGNRISVDTGGWPHFRALGSKDPATGKIVVTYSHFRTWRREEILDSQIAWNGLPSTFTWKQYRADHRDKADGRAFFARAGNQTNLPYGVDLAACGVGCIEITP